MGFGEDAPRRRDYPASPLRAAALGTLVGRGQPIKLHVLGRMLERHLGASWQIDPKVLYLMFEGFTADELAELCAAEPRGDRKTKTYRATEKAAKALDAWMRSPVRATPRRPEIHARIAVAQERHIPELLRALDEYEDECFRLLSKIEPAAPLVSWVAVTTNIMRSANTRDLRAELAWIDEARQWIHDWQDRGPQPQESGV